MVWRCEESPTGMLRNHRHRHGSTRPREDEDGNEVDLTPQTARGAQAALTLSCENRRGEEAAGCEPR
jgi:hypothetical protein